MAIFGKDDAPGRGTTRSGGNETTLSIISAGTTVTGDIECGGVLKVEGQILGGVLRARQVMLAKEGTIRGDVTAHEVVVGGVIDGGVTAAERLELQTTAVVNGDIVTKSIVVMEGARINGGVKMTELALVGRPEEPRETRESRQVKKSQQ
ncbi:MAG: polymer-forming cytoskeletal protein [Gemmatimonadota bacterium]|nr:polymer-forming cytoskeletal protein [Gemmatimonadota bacterium]